MSEAGYTLVETLAALLVIALTVSGLSAALEVMTQGQSRVARVTTEATALRRAQVTLDRLLEGHGPFRSNDAAGFTGADHLFQFDCAQAAPCAVQLVEASDGNLALRMQRGSTTTMLPLRSPGPAHLQYEGALGVLKSWPPPAEPRQALRAISVVRDGADAHGVLLESHLWTQEALNCEFDVVLQDCR